MPIQLSQAAYERKKGNEARREASRNAAAKAMFDTGPAFITRADRVARLAAAEREPAATPPAPEPAAAGNAIAPSAATPTHDLSKMSAGEKLALGRRLEQQQQTGTAAATTTTTGVAPPAAPPVDFSKMTAIQKLAEGRRLEQEKRRAAAGPTPPPAVDQVAVKLAGMSAYDKVLLGLRERSGRRAS